METSPKPSAVVFAKDIDTLTIFYREVLSMTIALADQQHVVLDAERFQLVIHGIPPELAMGISQIATIADAYDDQLRGRFGGSMPFEQGAIPTTQLGPTAGAVTDPSLPAPPPGAATPIPPAPTPQGMLTIAPAPPGIPPPPPGIKPVLIG